MPVLNPPALVEERVHAIGQFHRDTGIERAEIDVSGGVDSAVMVGLLARAVGPENVIAVHSAIHSDPRALSRAREVCGALGVRLVELALTKLYEELVNQVCARSGAAGWNVREIETRSEADRTILGSIRSTLRAPVGRAVNRMLGGGIRHGTGNECEDRFLRFYQKGGDGEVDTNPIAFLSKGEVYQLAIALQVPRSILLARPSPDLWGVGEEHSDESEIGAYLGFQPAGQSFYSYVDPDTGAYKNVGMVERTSRFLDCGSGLQSVTYGERLFGGTFEGVAVDDLLISAATSDEFRGVPPEDVHAMIRGARRVERATRHKLNPNTPTLGDRGVLMQNCILTDVLPT